MKKNLCNVIAIIVSLLFISTVGFAADPKAPAKPTPPAKAAVEKAADKKADTKAALIDINTATKAELSPLSGIGDVYSQKIIDGRPYAKKDQLKSKKIIPDATYEKIKDKIIAKQAPKKK
jgi:DNA uptake protein ComE-like DNA-binding protein